MAARDVSEDTCRVCRGRVSEKRRASGSECEVGSEGDNSSRSACCPEELRIGSDGRRKEAGYGSAVAA